MEQKRSFIKSSFRYLFYTALTLLAQSCSEDDGPHPVVEAEGAYTFNVKRYALEGTTLKYLGNDFDDTGTATLTQTPNGFEFSETGNLQFKASNIGKASHGFTFSIEQQTIAVDGSIVNVEGYKGAELAATRHHGVFFSGTKQLSGYVQFPGAYYNEEGNEVAGIIVIEWRGIKL